MSTIRVGDTVAFRRNIVRKCDADSSSMAQFRAIVTAVTDSWLFMTDRAGSIKVIPITTMCKVAHNGAILELV